MASVEEWETVVTMDPSHFPVTLTWYVRPPIQLPAKPLADYQFAVDVDPPAPPKQKKKKKDDAENTIAADAHAENTIAAEWDYYFIHGGCASRKRAVGRGRNEAVQLQINNLTQPIHLWAGWATGHEAVTLTPVITLRLVETERARVDPNQPGTDPPTRVDQPKDEHENEDKPRQEQAKSVRQKDINDQKEPLLHHHHHEAAAVAEEWPVVAGAGAAGGGSGEADVAAAARAAAGTEQEQPNKASPNQPDPQKQLEEAAQHLLKVDPNRLHQQAQGHWQRLQEQQQHQNQHHQDKNPHHPSAEDETQRHDYQEAQRQRFQRPLQQHHYHYPHHPHDHDHQHDPPSLHPTVHFGWHFYLGMIVLVLGHVVVIELCVYCSTGTTYYWSGCCGHHGGRRYATRKGRLNL